MGEYFSEETEEQKEAEQEVESDEDIYMDMIKFDAAQQAKIKEINENIGLQTVKIFGSEDKLTGRLSGGIVNDIYSKIDRPELRQLRLSYQFNNFINEMVSMFQGYKRLKETFEEYIKEKDKYVENILRNLKEKDSNIETIKQEAVSEAKAEWETELKIKETKPKDKGKVPNESEIEAFKARLKEPMDAYNEALQKGVQGRKLGFAKCKILGYAGGNTYLIDIANKYIEDNTINFPNLQKQISSEEEE